MFLSIIRVISVLCLLLSSQVWSGRTPITFGGQVMTAKDRPLVISTWNHARRTFGTEGMARPSDEIGYLDYAGIMPSLFPASVTGDEIQTINTTKRFLVDLKTTGAGLDFNGRVIIWAHGNSDGSVYFEFGPDKEGIGYEDASMLGKDLRQFFEDYHITVNRIDLIICCKNSSSVVDNFTTGYIREQDNIRIIGFRAEVGLRRDYHGNHISKFVIVEGNRDYTVPLHDYIVRSHLPPNRRAQQYIIKKTIGHPEFVPEPRIRTTVRCTIL